MLAALEFITLLLRPGRRSNGGNGGNGGRNRVSQAEFQTKLLVLMEKSTEHLQGMRDCLQKQRLTLERMDTRQEEMLERLRELSRR